MRSHRVRRFRGVAANEDWHRQPCNICSAAAYKRMPIYTFTHGRTLTPEQQTKLAEGVCQLHTRLTGAPAQYVRAVFVQASAGFVAGQHDPDYFALKVALAQPHAYRQQCST